MAIWQRTDIPAVILHSDRGTQFTRGDYQRYLKNDDLLGSMSAVSHYTDNAACEGFFGMLKRECVSYRNYQTKYEARGFN